MAIEQLGPGPHLMNLKLPKAVWEAVVEAANANYETPAAFVRRAVIEKLRQEGRV